MRFHRNCKKLIYSDLLGRLEIPYKLISKVLSIKTGEVVNSIIIVMIMGSLVISSYITIRTVRKKSPEIKDIKFLK